MSCPSDDSVVGRGTGRLPVWRLRNGVWVFLGVAVLVWRAGWGSYADAEFLATRVVPALPSLPRQDALFEYLYSSPIGTFVAAVVHAETLRSYQLLHLGVFGAFAAVIGVLVVRHHGVVTGALVGSAFVGSQASVVCLFWLGSYDVFTVGLTSLLVVLRNRIAAALVGFTLAFANAEQAVIVIALLAVLSLVGLFKDPRRLLSAGIGLLVGRVLLGWWLSANDVHHGRAYFFQHFGLAHFLDQFWSSLPWLVLTGLGASVVTVIFALRNEKSWRTRLVFVAALIAALVPVAISEDQTRVFAVITWPLVMSLSLRFGATGERRHIGHVALGTLVAAAAVPGIVIWTGRVNLATHHVLRRLRDLVQ